MIMHYLLDSGGLYHRIDPRMPENFALDDWMAMERLQDFADSVDLSETFKFIDNNFHAQVNIIYL